MYIGHIGLALASQGVRRRAPLWAALGATIAPDIVRSMLVLSGVAEQAYRWSHSLPAVLVLGTAIAVAYRLSGGHLPGAAALFVLVLSHLPADLVTNIATPGLELWVRGPRLYLRPWWDLALEASILVLGWLLYQRSLPPASRFAAATWLIPGVLIPVHFAFLYKMVMLP